MKSFKQHEFTWFDKKVDRGVPCLSITYNPKKYSVKIPDTANVLWGEGNMQDCELLKYAIDFDSMYNKLKIIFNTRVLETCLDAEFSHSLIIGAMTNVPVDIAEEVYLTVTCYFELGLLNLINHGLKKGVLPYDQKEQILKSLNDERTKLLKHNQHNTEQITYRIFALCESAIKSAIATAIEEHCQ